MPRLKTPQGVESLTILAYGIVVFGSNHYKQVLFVLDTVMTGTFQSYLGFEIGTWITWILSGLLHDHWNV